MSIFQKLAHYLFGWHYILYCKHEYQWIPSVWVVCRLKSSISGEWVVVTDSFIKWTTPLADIGADRWKPLTWKPETSDSLPKNSDWDKELRNL
jgi:hypothetical protein